MQLVVVMRRRVRRPAGLHAARAPLTTAARRVCARTAPQPGRGRAPDLIAPIVPHGLVARPRGLGVPGVPVGSVAVVVGAARLVVSVVRRLRAVVPVLHVPMPPQPRVRPPCPLVGRVEPRVVRRAVLPPPVGVLLRGARLRRPAPPRALAPLPHVLLRSIAALPHALRLAFLRSNRSRRRRPPPPGLGLGCGQPPGPAAGLPACLVHLTLQLPDLVRDLREHLLVRVRVHLPRHRRHRVADPLQRPVLLGLPLRRLDVALGPSPTRQAAVRRAGRRKPGRTLADLKRWPTPRPVHLAVRA